VSCGALLQCVHSEGAEIFASTSSWQASGAVRSGEVVTAAGPAVQVDGFAMVPIDPQGAVQRDLFVVVRGAAEPAVAAGEEPSLETLDASTALAVNWLRLSYRMLRAVPARPAFENLGASESELGSSAQEAVEQKESRHDDCRAIGSEIDCWSDCSVGNRSAATTLSTTVSLSSAAQATFRRLPGPRQDQRSGTMQLTELEEKQVKQLEKKLRDMDKLAAREARGEKLDPLQAKKLQGRAQLESAIDATVAMMKVRLGYRRRNQNSQW